MKERVSVRNGTSNILLICPHGHDLDDTNTNVLTMATADILDCHAVVNNGWRRSPQVDALKSLANCNDIDHCKEAVVKDEFYDPISSHVQNQCRQYDLSDPCICFLIHGIGNSVRKKANDPDLDIIVGYGNGHQPRYTCELWQKDFLVDALTRVGYKTYEGAAGGAYSARSRSNLTQAIHRKWGVNCFQLEFIYDRRVDDLTCKLVAKDLASVISLMSSLSAYNRQSNTPVYEI